MIVIKISSHVWQMEVGELSSIEKVDQYEKSDQEVLLENGYPSFWLSFTIWFDELCYPMNLWNYDRLNRIKAGENNKAVF